MTQTEIETFSYPGRKRRVMIWRDTILPLTETFIANQAQALHTWEPIFAGIEYVENRLGIVPDFVAAGHNDDRLRVALRSVDLVHAHFVTDAIDIAAVARKAGTPLVVTAHGYDVTLRRFLIDPYFRWRLAQMVRGMSFLIAVSSFIADQAIRLGVPAERLIVHHIGVPIPQDLPDTRERTGILFVGRLVEKKGCDDLLAAIRRRRELHDIPVSIVGDGPLKRKLKKLARGLNVDFLGARDSEEVRALMQTRAILCVPSRRARNGDADGLPMVILEGAANRIPVIASQASGIGEAIVNGETGLLYPAGDQQALARLLFESLNDSALRSSLAERARARVVQRFDIVRQTLKLEEIYSAAADNPLT